MDRRENPKGTPQPEETSTYSIFESVFGSLLTAINDLCPTSLLGSSSISQVLERDFGILPSMRKDRIWWNMISNEFMKF